MSVPMQLSLTTPLLAYSDCSSAIRRCRYLAHQVGYLNNYFIEFILAQIVSQIFLPAFVLWIWDFWIKHNLRVIRKLACKSKIKIISIKRCFSTYKSERLMTKIPPTEFHKNGSIISPECIQYIFNLMHKFAEIKTLTILKTEDTNCFHIIDIWLTFIKSTSIFVYK